jgi:hypothetical protein
VFGECSWGRKEEGERGWRKRVVGYKLSTSHLCQKKMYQHKLSKKFRSSNNIASTVITPSYYPVNGTVDNNLKQPSAIYWKLFINIFCFMWPRTEVNKGS